MGFNPAEWWEKWHGDKAPGKGRSKGTGGKAGTGKAPSRDPNPHNRKKRMPPGNGKKK